MKKSIFSLLVTIVMSFSAFAIDIDSAKESLSNAMPQTSIDKVEHSEIEGLFRVTTGANVFYYYPEKQLAIFGEIFSTSGVNLTSKHVQSAQQNQLDVLEDTALVIQTGEAINEIVEFSNPDCGACRHYEKYLTETPLENTTRKIFLIGWSDSTKKKIEHIMCSEDKKDAMHAIYSGADVKEFATCEHGKTQAKKHAQAAKALRVQSTPTLIINGTRVSGFKPEYFKTLLTEEADNELISNIN